MVALWGHEHPLGVQIDIKTLTPIKLWPLLTWRYDIHLLDHNFTTTHLFLLYVICKSQTCLWVTTPLLRTTTHVKSKVQHCSILYPKTILLLLNKYHNNSHIYIEIDKIAPVTLQTTTFNCPYYLFPSPYKGKSFTKSMILTTSMEKPSTPTIAQENGLEYVPNTP